MTQNNIQAGIQCPCVFVSLRLEQYSLFLDDLFFYLHIVYPGIVDKDVWVTGKTTSNDTPIPSPATAFRPAGS